MSLETDLSPRPAAPEAASVVWRSLAVLALVGAGLVAWRGEGGTLTGARVARLTVSGIITEDRDARPSRSRRWPTTTASRR